MRKLWHFIGMLFGFCVRPKGREWVLVDKTVLPSAWQQMIDKGLTPRTVDTTEAGATFFRNKVVYTYRCRRTKEVKKVVEYNP